MAYGVIVYESEHESFLSLPPEDVGNIVQNMIRTFRDEEVKTLAKENAYSISLCKRVSADKDKVVERVVAGSRGGAPKGNKNASKNKQNNQKQPTETSKTTNNNNYNNNNNNNNIGFKPNAFTSGCPKSDIDFEEIERKLIKN
jgi:hypothetical protein